MIKIFEEHSILSKKIKQTTNQQFKFLFTNTIKCKEVQQIYSIKIKLINYSVPIFQQKII